MANPTAKLDLVVNGVTTSYDIHDANAIPRSGGAVISGNSLGRNADDGNIDICGGTNWENGAFLALRGKNFSNEPGYAQLGATDGTNSSSLTLIPNGTVTWSGRNFSRTVDDNELRIDGGTTWGDGASIALRGKSNGGGVVLHPSNGTQDKWMSLNFDGTWTWDGTACQITSDQRYKQQITEIDDKLLDAWEDVNLVQFKYNDAVDQKGKDKARLHTGYVVQQIDNACKEHGVDISAYGLYCHEQYPEETEEVEVERADGTKTKERKVIREASEHYSLRYTEALIVECKYLRRCIERLTARIEQLEKEQEASK